MKTDLTVAAQELIDRLGNGAVQYISERVEQTRTATNPKEQDQALRLLTAVETLLDKES